MTRKKNEFLFQETEKLNRVYFLTKGELTLEMSLNQFSEANFYSGIHLQKVQDYKQSKKDKLFSIGIVCPGDMVGEEFIFEKSTVHKYSAKVTTLEVELWSIRVEYLVGFQTGFFKKIEDHFYSKRNSRIDRFNKTANTFVRNALFFSSAFSIKDKNEEVSKEQKNFQIKFQTAKFTESRSSQFKVRMSEAYLDKRSTLRVPSSFTFKNPDNIENSLHSKTPTREFFSILKTARSRSVQNKNQLEQYLSIKKLTPI